MIKRLNINSSYYKHKLQTRIPTLWLKENNEKVSQCLHTTDLVSWWTRVPPGIILFGRTESARETGREGGLDSAGKITHYWLTNPINIYIYTQSLCRCLHLKHNMGIFNSSQALLILWQSCQILPNKVARLLGTVCKGEI